MKWLEVIHLRATEQESDRLIFIIKQLIDEIREKGNCQEIKMFNRALLETDVCIHLYHDNDKAETAGSPIALHLASALKTFGMVNHTVWLLNDRSETR